jgi:hypothetical protein
LGQTQQPRRINALPHVNVQLRNAQQPSRGQKGGIEVALTQSSVAEDQIDGPLSDRLRNREQTRSAAVSNALPSRNESVLQSSGSVQQTLSRHGSGAFAFAGAAHERLSARDAVTTKAEQT